MVTFSLSPEYKSVELGFLQSYFIQIKKYNKGLEHCSANNFDFRNLFLLTRMVLQQMIWIVMICKYSFHIHVSLAFATRVIRVIKAFIGSANWILNGQITKYMVATLLHCVH